ncbi:hypothetical protein SAMN02745823_02439 [Sporobacter termitidis DSM 10068]|uniref:GTPase-associated system helical domain-containing protein n=1 Tax=Sporobacter termitidis DSM 10068 TaxID=1123282 RepID=A0A1M5YE79_9FIRM|nr:GTPase-associated system all-helical protein GASH [Sporobacter termitidis]SHI10371.1 hypothetical protein SAMN02745823_02439 [Sporobacter termitidis DSM 10068]
MKQFFSESYSTVCVDANREQLEMRWKGIEQYCGRKEFKICELVKMFYLLTVNDDFFQDFISVFNEIDISFSRNNKKELSVLAGNILVHLMEHADFKLDIIFTIICLSKYNIDVLIPQVIEKAYTIFGYLSAETREREMACKIISTKSLKEYALKLKDLAEMGTEEITGLATTINTIASSISMLMQNQSETKKAIEVYHEDSNILAWLFGNWSNDLGIALTKKIAQKDVALILAKELADLVSVMPGPYPIVSFLNKMLDLCKSDTKNYSLVEMVDAIDGDMKQSIIEKYNCTSETPENTPILFSIKSARDVNKPEVWKHVVSSRMGFEIDSIQNSILDWAFLMYFECMLIKRLEM